MTNDVFKGIDLDTICTNRSPPLNVERASSFHAYAPTIVLTVDTNGITESFLNDLDNAFEQFDLDTMCINHTPPDKKGQYDILDL